MIEPSSDLKVEKLISAAKASAITKKALEKSGNMVAVYTPTGVLTNVEDIDAFIGEEISSAAEQGNEEILFIVEGCHTDGQRVKSSNKVRRISGLLLEYGYDAKLVLNKDNEGKDKIYLCVSWDDIETGEDLWENVSYAYNKAEDTRKEAERLASCASALLEGYKEKLYEQFTVDLAEEFLTDFPSEKLKIKVGIVDVVLNGQISLVSILEDLRDNGGFNILSIFVGDDIVKMQSYPYGPLIVAPTRCGKPWKYSTATIQHGPTGPSLNTVKLLVAVHTFLKG